MRKKIGTVLGMAALLWLAAACENVSETPEVNKGYATNIRMPEPDVLTDADRAFMEAQEAEYKQNAK